MRSEEMQRLIFQAIEDAKGLDIRVLDVRGISDITDYMIVASGTSGRHVSSVADKVVDMMREHKLRPLGVEGKDIGEWVLIDFGDVVAHVMRPQIREFYNLEKLWSTHGQAGIAKNKSV